jgi:hypothetical protein
MYKYFQISDDKVLQILITKEWITASIATLGESSGGMVGLQIQLFDKNTNRTFKSDKPIKRLPSDANKAKVLFEALYAPIVASSEFLDWLGDRGINFSSLTEVAYNRFY